jgi:hypothetical protein
VKLHLGENVRILLPIEIQGVVYEYIFSFKVDIIFEKVIILQLARANDNNNIKAISMHCETSWRSLADLDEELFLLSQYVVIGNMQ